MKGDEALRKAIEAGNLQGVRRALAAGADPNSRYGGLRGGGLGILDEAPALMVAASAGHLDVAAALLDAGADIDATGTTYISYDADGDDDVPYSQKSALTVALEQGHLELARLLIERGASRHLETPVCSAAKAGSIELVKLIVAKGGSPNRADHNAHSPLYWAAEGGHLEIMDWLHAKGGRFSRRIDLEAARRNAREDRRRRVVRWLEEKTDRALLEDQYSHWRADVDREDLKGAFRELISAMEGTALEWGDPKKPTEKISHPEGWQTERRRRVNLRLGTKKVVHETTETSTYFEHSPNRLLRCEESLTLQKAAPIQMRYWWAEHEAQPVVVISCRGSAKVLENFDRALRGATLSFAVEWAGDSDYVVDVLFARKKPRSS